MTTEEIIISLGHLHSICTGADDSILSQEQKDWITSLHLEEFGQAVRECSCKNRYCDAVTVLYLRLRKTRKMEKEKKYSLNRGELIWYDNVAYTCDNLTDEVAEAYLKVHPDAVRRFERVPVSESPAKKTSRKKTLKTNK